MNKIVHSFLDSFLSLVFPPLCLHCQGGVKNPHDRFCPDCFLLLEMVDPKERCPFCFTSDYQIENHFCPNCYRHQPVLNRLASVFDYNGPAGSLVRQLKYGNQPKLAEGCGAYLAAQFIQLDWPMPDLIVPVPITWLRLMDRGYNQSRLLANSLGEILQCPVEDVLLRASGDYSQAGLSSYQRMKLRKEAFTLKPNVDLHDKCILLVDDVMTTGTTLNRCGEALFGGLPSAIYGLTFCRAM